MLHSIVDSSSREPHIVLLPGLDGTGQLFAPLLDALGSRVQTTVVRYGSENSFEDYVHTAANALPSQNAMVIAESFSGPVALELAARYPDRIRCLVLCATFARSPFRPLLRAARLVPAGILGPSPIQPFLLRHFCFNGEADRSLVEKALTIVRAVPPRSMKARLATLAWLDVRSVLGRIKTPALYLQASRDRLVDRQLSRELTNGLRDVSVTAIDGPHLLLQSRPRECAAAILAFAARHRDRTDE